MKRAMTELVRSVRLHTREPEGAFMSTDANPIRAESFNHLHLNVRDRRARFASTTRRLD